MPKKMTPMKPPESRWRRGMTRLLDVLYPPVCELCQAPLSRARSLCADCDAGLPRLEEPFCSHCGQPFFGRIDGRVECPNCGGRKLGFDFARPVLRRSDEAMALVHALKYGRHRYLAVELGRLAAEAFDDPRLTEAVTRRWPIVPVPLHRRREQHRHFNQAEDIACQLAQWTGQPVCRALRRVRATSTQTMLHRRERIENLKGAFALTRAGRRLAGSGTEGVVVLDDVLTTGSTLGNCASVLREAGIPRVAAVAIVRG